LKFDEYLESIRDVERRIQRAEEQNSRELPVVDQPMGIPSDYAEHARLMMDLLALAYQTDLTRSARSCWPARSAAARIRKSACPTRIIPCRTTRTSRRSSNASTK